MEGRRNVEAAHAHFTSRWAVGGVTVKSSEDLWCMNTQSDDIAVELRDKHTVYITLREHF